MFERTQSRWSLDQLAIGLSGLCAIHCFASAVVLGLLASASTLLDAPIIHETGLVLAILLGAVALGVGALQHGFMMPASIGGLGLGIMSGALTLPHGTEESLYTLFGVAILALGHDLNKRAAH